MIDSLILQNKQLVNWLMKHRGLLEFLLSARRSLYKIFFSGSHAQLIKRYLDQPAAKKLQLGCGFNVLPGWLNTDLNPRSDILFLDVTKKNALPSSAFDFVFSEHIIEHVPYLAAKNMMAEAFRVLKPGGVARIATPNLKFLIDLYQEPKTKVQKEYIKWSIDAFSPEISKYQDVVVINNFVRNWGHQFIYDDKALKELLEDVGFSNVKVAKVGESEHAELKNIEHHSTVIGDEFNQLETLIVEGTKPKMES